MEKKVQEIPVALDKDGKYRNLSSVIKDLNPESINFETLDKIKEYRFREFGRDKSK